MHTYQAHKDVITSSAFSFCKKSLITVSLDRTMRFWDLEKPQCTHSVIINSFYWNIFMQNVSLSSFYDVSLTQSENHIATAHYDGSVKMWAGRTWEMTHELKNIHDD